jgi:peptide/nickel transport system permease protein
MEASLNTQKTTEVYKKQSQFKEIVRRFSKSKSAVIGLILFGIVAVVLLLADVIVPYAEATTVHPELKNLVPNKDHIFGCDSYGRDIFARILHGGKISLGIALLGTLSSCIVGCTLGAVAGYYGGKVDTVIMRGLDIFMSVPDLLFTMAVVYALGANFINLLIALTLAFFTNYVRLVRSQVLNLAEKDYVEAARAGGAGGLRIIFTHIIPNAMGVIIVNTTLNVAKIIIYESTLSFLGLGMPPPAPEWGQMLSEAREYMRSAPHLLAFPALSIVITACAINLMGDGLRDALDPHLKS